MEDKVSRTPIRIGLGQGIRTPIRITRIPRTGVYIIPPVLSGPGCEPNEAVMAYGLNQAGSDFLDELFGDLDSAT